MAYKYILFDLDGTLTNPEEGITNSVVYSLEKQGIECKSPDHYKDFIGPPLDDSYEAMGFGTHQIDESIRLYGEYFETNGWSENVPYEGIHGLLEALQKKVILGVATSKPTFFADKILRHFNMSKYFEVVVGSNLNRTRIRKAEVIDEALKQLGYPDVTEVLMIGDRLHDLEGAKIHGIDAIRVLYGFGDLSEHVPFKPKKVLGSIADLQNYLLGEVL